MNKYNATLLFQYRVMVDGNPGKFRICEKSMILIDAKNASTALTRAKKIGRRREYESINDEGRKLYFEFVGVLDMVNIGSECEENEVWYEVCTMLTPKERKKVIIPEGNKLRAIVNEM